MMQIRHAFLFLLLLCLRTLLPAQHPANGPDGTSVAAPAPVEPATPLEAFQKGHFAGHFRSFFMATVNARQLSDYYAVAAGGALHYQTAAFRGFRFGLSGSFHYNLASSDLARPDSATHAANRYEIGLFDVEDPANRSDLDRFEELWLRYERKKWQITLGQQALQTPFINGQDGRMRPTYEAGLWAEIRPSNRTNLEGGWLWGMSPRSTVRWYSVAESIGLYPKGLNPDGTPSGYPGQVQTHGIGLLGLTRSVGANLKLQVWEQWVENVFNTALVQADYIHPLKSGHQLLFGLQLTHQDALSGGGSDNPAQAYFPAGSQSNAVSMQAGWQRGGWLALLAYTLITADGRFLAPREWGREPFYTFMTRERVEGSGDSHSLTGRLSWQSPHKKLRLEAAYGRFYLPDVRSPALNKYSFASFGQLNLDARYTFGGVLDGFRAQALFVYKGRLGEVYGNDKYVINRVDMANYNLVLNYIF